MDRLDFGCEFKLLEPSSGAIEGYASVFDVMDDGGDIVLPGAFKATLGDWRKRKSLPPMLWQHDTSNPVGVWTDMAEDQKGLKVSGELVLGVPQADVAYALMKRGAVKGLSMGYRARDYEMDRQTGARKLKKVDLYEISPVTIPMLREAQLTSVKAEAFDLDERQIERALRDEGFSNREAKIGVSVFKKMVLRDGVRTTVSSLRDAGEMLEAIRKAASAFA